MNEISATSAAKRTFTVTLFKETRTVEAANFMPGATRFFAYGVLAARYRSRKKLHCVGLEFETDPVQVEKLGRAPFNWQREDGFVFRTLVNRSHGNWKSQVNLIGWVDTFSPSQF